MDDSWRMRFGMQRRRSTEETPSYLKQHHHPIFVQTLNPNNNNNNDDFSDVFGGPPRTLHLSRNLSGSNFFQDEIFKAGDSMFGSRCCSSKKSGDILGFDEDVCDDDVRFRTRSQSRSTKSKSSSYDDDDDDASYSSSGFASNLRPVNVSAKWNPKLVADQAAKPNMEHFKFNGNANAGKQCKKRNCDTNARMMMQMMMSSNNFGFSGRVLSPERGTGEVDSFANLKQAVEDYELCSPPSSAKSSVCQEPEVVKNEDCVIPEESVEDEDWDVDDSYVIEINDFNCADQREEGVGVDEAIAWAKEKYQSGIQHEEDQSSEFPGLEGSECSQTRMDADLTSSSVGNDSIQNITENGALEALIDEEQKAIELLNEDIKLWSAYKETNIQLLLSTLHHILWSSSGWSVVSLADIIDCSQVKKAYQKARLCLHPDKLQQRGATATQKYIAAEAFSILQTAWEAFISQNSS
ncbi:unnamed protein product [Rhodiola kirilowii]